MNSATGEALYGCLAQTGGTAAPLRIANRHSNAFRRVFIEAYHFLAPVYSIDKLTYSLYGLTGNHIKHPAGIATLEHFGYSGQQAETTRNILSKSELGKFVMAAQIADLLLEHFFTRTGRRRAQVGLRQGIGVTDIACDLSYCGRTAIGIKKCENGNDEVAFGQFFHGQRSCSIRGCRL